MKTFMKECEELASLETFDPSAFRADTKALQQLCNFVLSVALIYNECKDIIYSQQLLEKSRPPLPFQETKVWGAWSGLSFHSFRLLIGLLHELFKLIRDNQTLIQDAFFKSVLKQINRGEREDWQTVVDIALGERPYNELGKKLLLIRHKVMFHYDPKAISAGYKYHFMGAQKRHDRAFVSRGETMQETRFYFADAAAQGYLDMILGEQNSKEIIQDIVNILRPLNRAIMAIIDAFIQKRGYAYQDYE